MMPALQKDDMEARVDSMMDACTNLEDVVRAVSPDDLRWIALAGVLRTMTTFLVMMSGQVIDVRLDLRRGRL